MRITIKKVAIVLAIVTIVMIVATAYGVVSSSSSEPKTGMVIWAGELDQKPTSAVVLTNPDPYILEAIENPGRSIYAGVRSEETEFFYEQMDAIRAEGGRMEYEGKYYRIDYMFIDMGLKTIPPQVIAGSLLLAGLGVCWLVVAYTYRRRPFWA